MNFSDPTIIAVFALPALSAILALALVARDLAKAIFALSAICLLPALALGAALGYVACRWPVPMVRVTALAALAVALGGCMPGPVALPPVAPLAHCVGAVDGPSAQSAHLDACDAAMTEACYQLASYGETVAHENPIDTDGAWCVTDAPYGGVCGELGATARELSLDGRDYCEVWIGWGDVPGWLAMSD